MLWPSELFTIRKKAFNCDNVIIGGLPRNDELFEQHDYSLKKCNEKLVVWLPTFRCSSRLHNIDSDQVSPISILLDSDFDTLNTYLEKNNIRLFIKLHPMQDDIRDFIQSRHITMMNQVEFAQKGYSVNSLLSQRPH